MKLPGCKCIVNDEYIIAASRNPIDMEKLESLYPGWKLPTDPKSVTRRRLGKWSCTYDVEYIL